MKTAEIVRDRIGAFPVGEPFTSLALLSCGTRVAVDHALSRFAKSGIIVRVAQGVFVRPRRNRFVGPVLPAPLAVARAIARQSGAKVQLNGAEAALELQLTTQQPVATVFHTSGSPRRIRMGALQITLKRVSPRKLALGDRPAGTALAALWYLGKRQVTEEVIEKVRTKLSPREFRALKAAASFQPAWMIEAFRRHEQAALSTCAEESAPKSSRRSR